jgi:hypothetical protein
MRNAVRSANTALGVTGLAIVARRAWQSPTVWVRERFLDARRTPRGTLDREQLTLEGAYRSVGRHAQAAFWGSGREDSSMLVQIALRSGTR